MPYLCQWTITSEIKPQATISPDNVPLSHVTEENPLGFDIISDSNVFRPQLESQILCRSQKWLRNAFTWHELRIFVRTWSTSRAWTPLPGTHCIRHSAVVPHMTQDLHSDHSILWHLGQGEFLFSTTTISWSVWFLAELLNAGNIRSGPRKGQGLWVTMTGTVSNYFFHSLLAVIRTSTLKVSHKGTIFVLILSMVAAKEGLKYLPTVSYVRDNSSKCQATVHLC